MKRILFLSLLVSSLNVFGGGINISSTNGIFTNLTGTNFTVKGVHNTSQAIDFGSQKGSNVADPVDLQDVVTLNWVNSQGFLKSPLTSTLDVNGQSFINVGTLTDIDGLSSLDLIPSEFGLYNSQALGSGNENINIVTDNGTLIVDAGGLKMGDATAIPMAATDSRLYVGSAVFEGYWPSMKFNIFYDGVGQKLINDGIGLFMYENIAGGYGAISSSTYGVAGSYPTTREVIVFPGSGAVLVGGATTDDATGAELQVADSSGTPLDISANTYWAQGRQGGSGFQVNDIDGNPHDIVGGLVMP